MSRIKEYYMKIHHPLFDIEREYLFNDILAKEDLYALEEEEKKEQQTILSKQAKIEIGEVRRKVEENQEHSSKSE